MIRIFTLSLAGVAVAGTALLTGPAIDARAPVAEALVSAAQQEPPYDGRYSFVRVQFGGDGGGLGGFGRRREPAWSHDYPRAERNFGSIVQELTAIDIDPDSYRILRMDDPEIFRFPIAYVVEVGSWNATRAETDALREYLLKGGFLIVDDFRDGQIYQLQAIFAEALPGLDIVEVPNDHDIFDSFYYIEDPHSLIPPYGRSRPLFLGVYEDNDPTKRLMAIMNYNNDMAEYWEFSDRGFYPVDLANEAYQFGVNYIMYALTH
jgi:hypothetical protein